MRGKVLFCCENIEQDAVEQVTVRSRIILQDQVLQFRDFHLDLVMPFAEDGDVIFRVFLSFQQIADIREDGFLFVRHMFVYLFGIFVEKAADHEGHIFRAAHDRLCQFVADMGKTEVQEIVVCIMQISDKRRDGDIFMDLRCRDCLRFRQKVDDSQECICVDLILPAYFPDVFLSEPQVDTEAAHHKDHRIILAYQVTHLACFPVFSVLHVSHIFYHLYSRLL